MPRILLSIPVPEMKSVLIWGAWGPQGGGSKWGDPETVVFNRSSFQISNPHNMVKNYSFFTFYHVSGCISTWTIWWSQNKFSKFQSGFWLRRCEGFLVAWPKVAVPPTLRKFFFRLEHPTMIGSNISKIWDDIFFCSRAILKKLIFVCYYILSTI